jgi:hypothetical protein
MLRLAYLSRVLQLYHVHFVTQHIQHRLDQHHTSPEKHMFTGEEINITANSQVETALL